MQNIKFSSGSNNKVSETLKGIKSLWDEKSKLIKNLWKLDRLRWHKFLTKEILTKAEKIWKQESSLDPEILVKYFSSDMTFYITEIEVDNPKQAFWYVVNESYWEWEFGYVDLESLSLAKNIIWMPVERDKYFYKKTINEIKGN